MSEPVRWSEASIISALAVGFEWWRRCCCPNVQEGSEMDFVMLTESDRMWECEVKISMADWRRDMTKVRRYAKGWEPARFYYAVPWTLIENGIPEWVPLHAGILSLRDDHGHPRVRCVRQARQLHRQRASPEVRAEMQRKVYYRYWRHVAPQIVATAPNTIEVPQSAETANMGAS